jgi:hypothetical protein
VVTNWGRVGDEEVVDPQIWHRSDLTERRP